MLLRYRGKRGRGGIQRRSRSTQGEVKLACQRIAHNRDDRVGAEYRTHSSCCVCRSDEQQPPISMSRFYRCPFCERSGTVFVLHLGILLCDMLETNISTPLPSSFARVARRTAIQRDAVQRDGSSNHLIGRGASQRSEHARNVLAGGMIPSTLHGHRGRPRWDPWPRPSSRRRRPACWPRSSHECALARMLGSSLRHKRGDLGLQIGRVAHVARLQLAPRLCADAAMTTFFGSQASPTFRQRVSSLGMWCSQYVPQTSRPARSPATLRWSATRRIE